MIKTILFDNNGVLTYCDRENTVPLLAKHFGIPRDEMDKVFGEEVPPADAGFISTDKFFENLSTRVGKKHEPEKMWKILLTCYYFRPGMPELLLELRNKYQIALLTNFIDAFDLLNKSVWHYENIFDHDKIFVSSKLHLIKPNADFYEYAIRKLERRPEEIVFVDDRKENIDAALKVGMNGIVFQDVEQLKNELDGILEVEKENVR